MAALKRAFQLGVKSDLRSFGARQFSQMVKSWTPARLVDTLALVRCLEAQGVPSKQAEVITSAINDSLEKMAPKTEIVQESNLSKLRSEFRRSQERRLALLQHEFDKLHDNLDKMHRGLKHDIDRAKHAMGA